MEALIGSKLSVMEGRLLSGAGRVGLDENEWNALTSLSETNTVFQTYQWMKSWLKAFGDQYEQLIIAIAASSKVVGIAPFIVEEGFAGERIVRFLGDGKADYCDFITTSDRSKVLGAIFDALFVSAERWHVIELNNIPAESSTIKLVQTICHRSGYRILEQEQYRCPTLVITGHKDEAIEIFNKPALRRRQRYFEKNGLLTFKDLTGAAAISYLGRFFDQHVARWAGSKSPSLFLDERNRTFYRELAGAMADKGGLLLSVAEFNGQPIAIHYGFDYNGKLLWYKPSFDVAYAKHSPGLVLIRHLIGYAIKQGRDEFDFTIGDEPFKSRFTNYVRKTMTLKIFRNSGRYYYEHSKHRFLASVKKLS